MTTILRVYIRALCIPLIAFFCVSAARAEESAFPLFRHVDSGAVAPLESVTGPVKFLTDADFPPFSFQNADGAITGISVDLAMAACAELKITCTMVVKPFAELLPALKNHEGDAIVSGLRLTPEIVKDATSTRPYFFSFGRFVTRMGMPFTQPDIKTLAGRRIGYVKATAHEAFLAKYYERAALTPFENEAAMFEALRTAAIDVAFADALHAAFWLKGSDARGCCITLGGGFVDRSSFSRSMSLLVSADEPNLREALDFSLDKLEEKGVTAKIFARYIPDSPY